MLNQLKVFPSSDMNSSDCYLVDQLICSDPLLQFTLMYLRMSKFYMAFDHLKDLRDEGEKTLKKSEQHVVC